MMKDEKELLRNGIQRCGRILWEDWKKEEIRSWWLCLGERIDCEYEDE